jgi:hypothetical protein
MTGRSDDKMMALGFRVKSGHAIAVALAGPLASPTLVAREVVLLSDPKVESTRQPFHEGFGTAHEDRAEIARLTAIVQQCARRSITDLLNDERLIGRVCRRAGLVVGSVIEPAKVGNLHIRAHANEGRLFRTVVEEALRAHAVACTIIVEKKLAAQAATALRRSDREITRAVADLRAAGCPWRAEEKAAATAAWIALAES